MKNSRKIIFSILACFVLAFGFLLSLFNNDVVDVKADSMSYSSTFTSSDNIVALTGYAYSSTTSFYNLNEASPTYSFMKYSFKISNHADVDPFVYSIDMGFKGSYSSSCYLTNTSYSTGYNEYVFMPSSSRPYINFNNYSINRSNTVFSCILGEHYTCIGMICDYYYDGVSSLSFPSSINESNFNLNIVSVELGSKSNISSLNLDTNSNFTSFLNNVNAGTYNYVCYTDSNNFRYIFFIPCARHDANWSELFFSYRKYYLNFNLSDNSYYQDGYRAGLLDNQQNIYNDGYSDGNIAGYNNGYNAGINDSNQYSFLNLFGAVLDAPVQTLIGLLNFNLLGVNLFALFTGILTIIVFAFIIKTFKGGR